MKDKKVTLFCLWIFTNLKPGVILSLSVLRALLKVNVMFKID